MESFDSLESIAARLGAGLSGTRLHGALVGGLCADAAWVRAAVLLREALELDAGDAEADEDLDHALQQVEQSLRDPEFRFTPFLPDDEELLGERAAALGEWCDAFVLAFAVALRTRPAQELSDEGEEILADIGAIAGGLDPETLEEGDEDDERDFMQIAEFVRLGALSLFAERAPAPVTGVLH